jgi:hypothetical protein
MIEIEAPLEKTWGRIRTAAMPPNQGRARVKALMSTFS